MTHDPLDTTTQYSLHDLAKAEAERLREAAIDDFWRGADAVWQRCLTSGQVATERSEARLRARLVRRARGRDVSGQRPLTVA